MSKDDLIEDVIEDVQEAAENIFKLGYKKILGFATVLSGLGGFFADVLQPLAPFALYILIGAFLISVAALIYYMKCKKGLITALVSSTVLFIMGILVILQYTTNSKVDGLSSKVIPGVDTLQQKLGLIDEKLDGIKSDTEKIIKQGDEQAGKLDQIDSKIDSLSNNGGIRKSPQSAEDYYANAKVYELGGDYANAKRSYEAYFSFNTGKLDPHLRLKEFLTVNNGLLGARDVYTSVIKENNSVPSQLVRSILFPSRDARVAQLNAFIEKNPDYAPAYYFLSKEYSFNTLGQQSISDKREEYKWLQAFAKANENGKLVKHFIDKDHLSDWQEDVAARLKLTEAYKHLLVDPVSVIWSTSNSGFTAIVQIKENSLDILYREKGKGDFKSLGSSGQINPATGKPIPNMYFTVPLDQEPTVYEVKYKDINGRLSEVYEVALEEKTIKGSQVNEDGTIELDQQSVNILNMTKTSWIGFAAPTDQVNLYFTHILGHRGLLKKIMYGIDKETPDTELKFPEYNKAGFAPIDPEKMKVYLKVPRNTEFATIQVTLKDGTQSEVVRVNNQHKK